MGTLDILEGQIRDQIEGKIAVAVLFTDCDPEPISLYAQEWRGEDCFYIEPVFCKAKMIPKKLYDELYRQIEGISIDSRMSYNNFFNRYYNNI